jgi:endonuclease/exonuclease/phosphatase (EEP) superfamily protein YafD
MAAGTLLSMSRSTHWLARLWDFPRVQMAVAAAASGLVYALVSFRGRPLDWAFLAVAALTTAWQLRRIFPYLPVAPVQVERSRDPAPASRLRLLIANVLMENTRHDLLLRVIGETDPDVVLAVETDGGWARALEPLAERYPHVVRQPQDNYYGLMLFSRLPLVRPRIEFLVQDDIPSVHTRVRLPDGREVVLHGLHPRPPEPVRDQDSTPRDAELVLVGRAIGRDRDRPTVVAGDLNDVAWSRTTGLFLKLSRLLDPRLGRGLYNSYHAKNPLFRYPLDHVFHSHHFRLTRLERLRSVGSDHFPMLVELSLEEDAPSTQQGEAADAADEREASERLEKQAEAAATGDDRPGRE